LGLLLGLTATLAFAQTSSFGQAAQGIATDDRYREMGRIILCIICGIGLMAGGPGTFAKASGLILRLIFCPVCLAHHQLGAVGIDRKLAGLALLLSIIVGANDGGSKIAAIVLFVALCAIGCRMTR
jgi:hypothetical protein